LETGIFIALKYLLDNHSLTKDEDINKLKELSVWFNRNMEKPTRFSKGASKLNADVSLLWFKDSAKEHINLSRLERDLGKAVNFFSPDKVVFLLIFRGPESSFGYKHTDPFVPGTILIRHGSRTQ
jgi:hypothetical protein